MRNGVVRRKEPVKTNCAHISEDCSFFLFSSCLYQYVRINGCVPPPPTAAPSFCFPPPPHLKSNLPEQNTTRQLVSTLLAGCTIYRIYIYELMHSFHADLSGKE